MAEKQDKDKKKIYIYIQLYINKTSISSITHSHLDNASRLRGEQNGC